MGEFCDDLFDNGVSESVLAFEMVVKRPFGDIGGSQNGVNRGTLKSVPENLSKGRL